MLVLHIGRHKCGSSSIQYFMSCNAERLRELGVIYPTVGRKFHAHHALATKLRANAYEEFDSILDLHADRAEHVVVSSEELSLLSPMQITEVRRRTDRHKAVVVFYIRDLVGMIPSIYNERTRKGMNLLDFDSFYRTNNLSRGLKIFARAEVWAQSFGWENVRIRSLDPRNLSGATLIDDFLSIVRLSLGDFGSDEAPGLHPQNVSHGWKVLEVLRAQFAEVAPHRENLEIRRGRPYIQRRLASSLRASVQEIMAELNLDSQRAQYVSAQQWKECHEAYGRLVAHLNKVQVGHTIPIPEYQMIKERPFLPSLGEISMGERREIAARLQRQNWPRSLADTVVSQPLSAVLTNA
jgi:hypothetical protein